ncbi:hypothetical protein FRC04_001404 [Tulasnella sp. 424]|nr:hypothetical protein FRC04_001404 [Tulasnella sp. 424]KAG8968842.1 hypothetical protein FRC05_001328 [Tulasnella sp. 425]
MAASETANVTHTGGPSYIQNMPVELFQFIIRAVVRDLPPPPSLDYFRSLAYLRLVCKGWTRVVEGMPELWSDLSPHVDEQLLDLALARSLDSPLMIRGWLKSVPTGKIEKLVQHAHRWKTLNVSGTDGDAMDRILAHPVPLLEELIFSAFIPEPPSNFFNNIAPKLQSVHIANCGLQWSSPAFFNLRELTLENVDTGAPDVDNFIDILFASPRLIRLNLRNTPLKPSSLPPRLVPLRDLQFFGLEGLSQDVVHQIVGSIDMPMSTYSSISFSLEDFTESTIHEQLEPIAQRLRMLAEVLQGARSTMTIRAGFGWRTTVAYMGNVARDGGLTCTVCATQRPDILLSVFGYFSRHLGDARTSSPPVLRLVNGHHLTHDLTLLEEMNRHLPDTREVHIYNPIHRRIVEVLDRLFALSSPNRLFTQLSVLTIKHPVHDGWAAWLEEKRAREDEQEANEALPLTTLKIKGGYISFERLQGLRKLVPEVVLDHVEVQSAVIS